MKGSNGKPQDQYLSHRHGSHVGIAKLRKRSISAFDIYCKMFCKILCELYFNDGFISPKGDTCVSVFFRRALLISSSQIPREKQMKLFGSTLKPQNTYF